jgi:His-Xaa-Ser system protein HxsD
MEIRREHEPACSRQVHRALSLMDGVLRKQSGLIAVSLGSSIALEIDTSIYEVAAVLRACYKLTGRCYFFLARCPEAPHIISVMLSAKQAGGDLDVLTGELCNELLDQQIRETLARESGPIRELIVAQAFSEGNLLDPLRDEGNYQEDPLGIGERR